MAGGADDRFREMFFEEARELLHGLEDGLLELERKSSDRAHLDKTFRAAHSIKGAAAMVGLADLAEFTHHIESVLDKIRNGKLAVGSYLTNTLLQARDHLDAAVEAEARSAPIPAPADLVLRLQTLVSDQPGPPPAGAAPPKSPAPPRRPEPPDAAPPPAPRRAPRARAPREVKEKSTRPPRAKRGAASAESTTTALPFSPAPGGLRTYRITLRPGPEILKRGVNPLGVLDELRELGEARVTTDPTLVPPLEELDPERCYLDWIIEVTTEFGPDRIDEVFLFLAEDSEVQIELLGQGGAIPPPLDLLTLPEPAAGPAAHPSQSPPEPALPPVAARPNGSPPKVSVETARALAPTPAPAAPVRVATRVRVDAGLLDDLVGLAGELAVLSDNLQGLRDLPGSEHWVNTLESLDRVSRLIRDTTLELRMVPVEELFSRFPRVVRDAAEKLGKEIDLRIIGQETRIDRTIIEKLSDPMVHLIRNAADHGLETPEERLAAGKSRVGRITLWAGHEGDRVALRIEEDGRGLDRGRIVKRGIARGLVPVGTSPDDPRVDSLIFEPGFSTRDEVTDYSGRGVGLDVVRERVRELRGSLAVESTPGQGTAFILRLPLTLALIDGLLVETAGSRYVVPLAQVEECVALNGTRPALSKGRPCVSIRGELVPMVPLRSVFHAEGPSPARQELLLTRHAGQRVGVAVDRLLGRVQAVIQSLGDGLGSIGRFSGATILGDGSVSLILDLSALVAESRAADKFLYAPTERTTA